jgi:hypothetical protein
VGGGKAGGGKLGGGKLGDGKVGGYPIYLSEMHRNLTHDSYTIRT